MSNLNKMTFIPLFIVLIVAGVGFYFLYTEKSQVSTDIDILKEKMEHIQEENHNLHLRLNALEENSVNNISLKAGKTLRKTLDAMLEVLDEKIDEARQITNDTASSTETKTDT